jgi:ankyrin repeat protein
MLRVDRFRWAACQLDVLKNCFDPAALQNALETLPKTLDETYARILRSIPLEHKKNAIRILQFLTYSERPLTVEEAVDAIAVNTEGDRHFNPEYRMFDSHEISYYCSSLVVMVSVKGHSYDEDDERVELQLSHFSVKEYLTSDRIDKAIAKSFQEIILKASIATVCLAYLLDLDRDLPTKELRKMFPLAQYCARYWITFAVAAESKDEILQGFIKDFFCHESSYRNCYSLYRPDRPWENKSAEGEEELASPLYYASFGGLINAVKYLLSQGADVNAQGGYDGNALQAASHQGHEKVVELLLDKGADVNAQGEREYGNALQAASHQGHEKVVELLLGKGADVNVRGGGWHGNALYAASGEGHEKVVKLLLGKGADVNARGRGEYDNALQAASGKGHEKVVKLLLSKGADVNAQCGGEYGNALQAASDQGHEKVVELLLGGGAVS